MDQSMASITTAAALAVLSLALHAVNIEGGGGGGAAATATAGGVSWAQRFLQVPVLKRESVCVLVFFSCVCCCVIMCLCVFCVSSRRCGRYGSYTGFFRLVEHSTPRWNQH